MKKLLQRERGGFTLIELLVVIGIIGILAAIVFAGMGEAREKSRDTKRVADLKNLELTLALYFETELDYPANLGGLVTQGLISSVPTGPNGTSDTYTYSRISTGPAYTITADLESTTDCYVKSRGASEPSGFISCDEF